MDLASCSLRRVASLLLFFCALSAAKVAADETQWWQLTFAYDQQELVLVNAAQFEPLAKEVVTPGLGRAAMKLAYTLQWENENGEILHQNDVVVPLGLHENMSAEQNSAHHTHIMGEGGFVLRMPGPPNGATVSHVRLVKHIVAAFDAASPDHDDDEELPPPFLEPEVIVPFQFAAQRAASIAAAGPVGVTKVHNRGEDRNRLVIVITGDGFTAANLASGSFSNYVRSFLQHFFGTSPWNSYSNTVNVYRIDVQSNESGADYEDFAPGSGGSRKDTYFDAAFWTGNTERCLFLSSSGIQRAFQAADASVGVGLWDEILVFVNSTKYGGCGGAVGVSSVNSSADEIQVHEFGHSFGNLADEYDYGSTSTNCTPSPNPRNVDCANAFPSVKWDLWVTPGTPIPTPETSAYATAVGAFEGAGYQTVGKFRPRQNCKMRNLGAAFCEVCKEGHILRIFERINLVDTTLPATGPAEVATNSTTTFRLFPVGVSGLSYAWSLGGAPLSSTSNTLNLASSQITAPDQELKVMVTHQTAMVRNGTIQDIYTWRLNVVEKPSVNIADVALNEPSTTANANFPVRLSFASQTEVRVGYHTLPGSAEPGSDYTTTSGIIVFPPGTTEMTVPVPVHPDTVSEAREVFFVNLFHPENARLGDSQAGGVIRDDDNFPVVRILAPTNNTLFTQSQDVLVEASASDSDGYITETELFADQASLGATNSGNFSLVWSNVLQGIYNLTAVTTDNSGRQATSSTVRVIVSPPVAEPVMLIALTNGWRYDASTNDYGTAWKEPAYNDAGWAGPAAALFYNETGTIPGPKNTPVSLTNAAGARIRSYYYRTHFNFSPEPSPGITLLASNLIDDGAIFYLNGAELGRLRISAGTVIRTTLANAQPPGGDASNFEVLNFPSTALRQGDNVLAVSVHQQTDSSSDTVFGMSLKATFGFPPFLIDSNQPADRIIVQGQAAVLSASVAGTPTPTYQWFKNGAGILNATNATYSLNSPTPVNEGNYHCEARNALGMVATREAVISYSADTTPPFLSYAYGGTNPGQIAINFSELLNGTDAVNVNNYRVQRVDNGTFLTISQAQISGTNVTLITSGRLPGVNYLLTVNNIRDRFGNAILPDSTYRLATELNLVVADLQPWSYFQSDTEPAPGWNAPGYQESPLDWRGGVAAFDAKRPAGRTTIPPNNTPVRTMLTMTNPPGATEVTISYYFRTQFDFPGSPMGARLALRAIVDDGAVFYLNGEEAFRLGMAPFPANILYNTLADRSQGDSQTIMEGPFNLPVTALRYGRNVLAVEVHQAALDSSDVSFTAQLIGQVPYIESYRLEIDGGGNSILLRWQAAGTVLQQSETLAGDWTDVFPRAVSPYAPPRDENARFYRLRPE